MASPKRGMGNGSMASRKRAIALRLPQGWGWAVSTSSPRLWIAIATLLPQRGGWFHGPTASPEVGDGLWLHGFPNVVMGYGSTSSLRLGMGNGSTASPKRGWAMDPLLPQGKGLMQVIDVFSKYLNSVPLRTKTGRGCGCTRIYI